VDDVNICFSFSELQKSSSLLDLMLFSVAVVCVFFCSPLMPSVCMFCGPGEEGGCQKEDADAQGLQVSQDV
jgi:hypothetical protein